MAAEVQLADCRAPGCRDWVTAGRPWTLAPSMRALQRTVELHGFTVYAYPDRAHLVTTRPEDHTSFSTTGWPGAAPRWFGNADDIMPRGDSAAAREELEELARQIIADKDAGVPGTEFIKYINWSEASGECWHTSWQPDKRTVSSSDRGHIHISGRSDWATRPAIPYDPVARMRGLTQEDEMRCMLVRGFQPNPDQLWLVYNNGTRRRVKPEWWNGGTGPVSNAQIHQATLLGSLVTGNGPGWEQGGRVFVSGGDPDVWGVDLEAPRGGLSDEQVEHLGETMTEAAFLGAQRAERE